MSSFDSILVPLDGSVDSAKSLGCATWLAERLKATLHVLSAGHPELPARDELRRLQVPEAHWPNIMLHQAETFPEQAVLDAAERYAARMIVMAARGESAAEPREPDELSLGHVTRSVLENTEAPVLVLPSAYRQRLPWTTALVPISGDPRADEALTVAVRLSNELGLWTTVVHVLDGGDEAGLAATRYADSAHHEYPDRLEELVRHGLSACGRDEAKCIADVALLRGDVADELLNLVEDRKADLVVIGWRGRFYAGHAQVVRALLARSTVSLLFVKASRSAPFKLKVGDELD